MTMNTKTATPPLPPPPPTPEVKQGLDIWHNPTADYGWGLGPVGSITAVICLFACLLAFIPPEDKLRNVLVVAVVGTAVVGPFALRDKWGRNLYTRISSELRWWWHRLSGENFYEAAWFSTSSVTKSRLPGLLSQLSVGEQPTEQRNGSYAVLHHPSAKTVSVVVECRPAGDDLADPETIEAQQQRWAAWLDAIADEPNLAGIQVVSEAAASDRQHAIEATRPFSGGMSPVADRIMVEMAEACAGGIATSTWVTISWHTKSRTDDDYCADVMPARVERLCAELSEAGGGLCVPLSKPDLGRLWAAMYHPDRREIIAQYPNQTVNIADAGPTTHNDTRHRYQMDRHDAVSLTVGQAPDGHVTTAIHERLANGIDGTVAVRWAQLLRPVAPAEARSWANSIQRGIETRLALRGDRKTNIADVVADEDTTKTAAALARGRTLTRAGFTITLTVKSGDDIAAPIERTINACSPLSPHLRVMDAVHQTSWVATLPGAMPIPETLDSTTGNLNQ